MRTILLTLLLAPAPTLAQEKLSAVGIGVADLDRSTQFYTQALGLQVLRTYELGYLNEVVLGHKDTDNAVLVLMNWPNDDARKYDGGDVKVVFNYPDVAAAIERMRAMGSKIDREALPHAALNGTIIGFARDPDNYVVELIQR